MFGRKEKVADRKREALREDLWPGSGKKVWRSTAESGYFPSPRVLPLLCTLIREKTVCGQLDASSVYVELLHRDMGQGIVEILDEEEHAYYAGYTNARGLRTWRERIRALEAAGFIKVFPKGRRDIGYVGIPHPRDVVAKLHAEGKVPSQWWQLYRDRLRQIGGEPEPVPVATPKKGLKVIAGAGGTQRPSQRNATARARQRRG